MSAENVIGHKFKIGQIVYFRPKSRSQSFAPSETFQITARLPKHEGEFPIHPEEERLDASFS